MYLESSGNGLYTLSESYTVASWTPNRQLQDPTVNDSPQPQASFTFGLLNANRALSGDKGKNAEGMCVNLP